jgi:hypothetical protein
MPKGRTRFGSSVSWVLAAGLFVSVMLALSGCMDPDPIVAVPATITPDWPTLTAEATPTAAPMPEAYAFPLPAPAHVGIQRPQDETCIDCHTDEGALKASIDLEEDGSGSLSGGEDWARGLPTLEPWEKVFLDRDEFFETMHGRYGCTACHGGAGDTRLKDVAHRGMISEPSAAGVCEDCHAEEVASDQSSLHTNLAGYRSVLLARSSPEKVTQIEVMMGNHCESCHTATCGQCHVSRPARLGGGLVSGHLFENTPVMNLTCAGCHGSRIEDEYKGENGKVPGDVHWVQGEMLCSGCHGVDEFHGTMEAFVHRYDGRPTPDCQAVGCHPDVAEDDGIAQHGDSHLSYLSCQACHSTTYKNCYGCHVGVEEGTAYFEVDPPQLAFKIGRNPIRNRYRPWKYVPVRHVPIARDSFAYYGESLLPGFDALPTWKYTTPHNIQRITPQTETCNACHGNAQVFLTAGDVATDEQEANAMVIVEEVPAPVQ